MNKYLAEQLLVFNQTTNDEYYDNWGTVLKFVHEDPDSPGYDMNRNNSGIEIFQRQMQYKEELKLQEQSKKNAHIFQSNNKSQATQYHQEQRERLQALVEEANMYNLQVTQLGSNDELRSPHLPSSDDNELSRQLSNQSIIDYDRSIENDTHVLSIQQQVSFCDDLTREAKKKADKTEPPTPYGPKNGVGDTDDDLNLLASKRKLKSIVKRNSIGRQMQNSSQITASRHDIERSYAGMRPSLGQQSTEEIKIMVYDDAGSSFQMANNPETRRRNTVQNQAAKPAPTASNFHEIGSPMLYHTQQDGSFFNRLQKRNAQVEEQRSPSPFTNISGINLGKPQRIMADDILTATSPSRLQDPINLNNLESLNLRNHLLSRLKNFEDKKKQNEELQNFRELQIDIDQESAHLNSTQEDSIFGGYINSNEQQVHGLAPLTHHNQFPAAAHKQVSKTPQLVSQQFTANVTPSFMSRFGKQVSHNSYMLSMLQIQSDVRQKEIEAKGRKTAQYFLQSRGQQKSSQQFQSSFTNVSPTQVQQPQPSQNTKSLMSTKNSKGLIQPSHQIASIKAGALPITRSDLDSINRFASPQPAQRKKLSHLSHDGRSANNQSRLRNTGRAHNFSNQDVPVANRRARMVPANFQLSSNLSPSLSQETQQKQQAEPYYIYKNHQKKIQHASSSSKPANNNAPRALKIQSNFALNTSSQLDLTSQQFDSNENLLDLKSYQPIRSSLIPLPSQSNSFFASGFKMINPNNGDLERLYQSTKNQTQSKKKKSVDEHQSCDKLFEIFRYGKPDIDRTRYILKQLKRKTPSQSVNLQRVQEIKSQAKSKVDYVYRERFNGIYEERKRKGQLKREDSWKNFVEPDVGVGMNNPLQHAYNTDYQETNKDKNKDQEEAGAVTEPDPNSPSSSQPSSANIELGLASKAPVFRNAIERFHYQFDSEKIENINESVTFDRIQKANRRFEVVIEKAKPQIKLYNLLGYTKAQYILFRQIMHWMRSHEYSDKKQTDNIKNVQFARQFFNIIDESETGKLSMLKLAVPMIALGLSSDSSFIMKVMKAISPYKFGKMARVANPFEVNQLTLREFIKIFKKDQVSENLTEMLCNKIIEKQKKQEVEKKLAIERRSKQLQIVQNAAFVVSTAKQSTTSSNKNISFVNLAIDANSDEDPDEIVSDTKRESVITAQQIVPGNETQRVSSRTNQSRQVKNLEDLARISINDMLMEVRNLWFSIDNDRGLLELELREVARLLCKLQVLPDVSSAENYIQATIQSKTTQLDYDQFNAVFSKGIFRHAIVSKAHLIEQEAALNPLSNPEEKLEFKMIRTKNKNLTDEIKLGRIESHEEQVEVQKRPILTELWSIFYKNVPASQRETYENFFKRMQGLVDETVKDPAAVDLDAFSKLHRDGKIPVPHRNLIGMVTAHHAEMAECPYPVDEEDDIITHQRLASAASQDTQINSQASSLKKKRSGGGPAPASSSTTRRGVIPKEASKPVLQRRGTMSGISPLEPASSSSARKVVNAREGKSHSQMSVRKLDSEKSQMSASVAKGLPRPDTQGNMSSHRTVASSSKRQPQASANMKQSQNQACLVKFNDQGVDAASCAQQQLSQIGWRSKHRLELKLLEDQDQLMIQRKQRFDQLRQLQSQMSRPGIEKPAGSEYLEAIYERQEREREERRARLQQEEESK